MKLTEFYPEKQGRPDSKVALDMESRSYIAASTPWQITERLTVRGVASLSTNSQAVLVSFPSETVAANGIWITLKSTVTSGDLTGIRSRVYGNAASSGANVRGGYFEAKMAAASKYVAMLEGSISHADYSAGSITVSGDVRGLTSHISQGSGLNAANLYGLLVSIQTRGDETITSNDVGIYIKNEAVGGAGRQMDAAVLIGDVNVSASAFTYGIDLYGASIATADIRFANGETIIGLDDVPVDAAATSAISSNWAYDHVAAVDPHTGYRLESADHSHQTTGAEAGQLDHGLALTSASLLDDDHPGYRQKHGIQTIGAVTFADATHILTVATGITYWFNGTQKVISGSTTCDIDTYETLTDNTVYWFYFDDTSGTLKCSDELPDFKANVYVAVVFWNGTNGAIHREHHGHIRNLNWHEWAHFTVGLRYESGLTLTLPTTDTDNALQIESGIIWDEDLESVISQQTTCRIVYKASASIYTWVASSLPYAGSGVQPQYLDTDNYTLTNVGASDFVCMWVYATNDIDRPIYIIPTHASTAHNVIALARAEVQPILAALNLSPEVKLIYRFIYKGNGEFQESNDYRLTQALPSGGVATVNAGSVAFIPTGDIAATTVQTAIEELDTEKIKHSLATAVSDFLIASGVGVFIKKTLAETLTILGKAVASGLASLNASSKVVQQPASISDHLDDTAGGTDAETTKASTSNVVYDHTANTTTAHGAVSAATASKLVVRDASARAKFAAPAAAGDALIKGTRVTADELPAVTDEYYLVGTGGNMEERAVLDIPTHAALFTGLHGQAMVIKPDDEAINNDEGLQNDDDLVIAVGIDENWLVTIVLYVTSASATPDIDYLFTVPTNGAFRGLRGFANPATAAFNYDLTAEGTIDGVDNTTKVVAIMGYYIGGDTAGNLQLQWAQHVATVEDTKILTDSFMIAHRIV